MYLKRFSFIIFLLSSFFLLFLFFFTPKAVYAGHTCPATNSYCDGTYTCNDLCDPYGHACGTVCGSCGVVCGDPPPGGECSTDANCPGEIRGADYCCGSSICNNKTTYRCGADSVCTRASLDVNHTEPCANGCSNGVCNSPPAPSCNYNRSYNQCCGTGLSQSVQEYTYSDGSGVCNFVVGACNQADPGCGGATPPPGATCNYSRTYNQCCGTGLSERVDEYVWSNGSGACNYVVGACNQADSGCGGAPPPPPPGPEPTPAPGNCYDGVLQNNYTTGPCTVTIQHLGWDTNDGSIGGYRNSSSNPSWRSVDVNDSDLTCKPNINLTLVNEWTGSSSTNFHLWSYIAQKDSWHGMGSGFQLNSSGCTMGDCSTTQVGPSQVVSLPDGASCSGGPSGGCPQGWRDYSLNYCGNGICSCGETSSTCPADCGVPAPTGTISASPNPCTIPYGGSTCTSTITWSTTNAVNPSVKIQGSGNTFSINASGNQDATWITAGGATFQLYSGSTLLNDVFVYGRMAPSAPTVSYSGPCINALTYSGSGVTISWTNPAPPVTYVDIGTDASFSSFWNKNVSGATSTTAPDGFNGYSGVSGAFVANTGTPYYVRLYNGSHSNSASFTIPRCPNPGLPTLANPSCPEPVVNTTFNWTPAIPDYATSYDLRIDANPTSWVAAGQSGNIKWDTCTGLNAGDSCANGLTTTSYISSPTTAGIWYGWRVRANGPFGSNGWAVGDIFTCPTITIGPWIQTTGDVHSNEEINAPGGP